MTTELNAPLSAADIARLLGLQPHPEGGFYRETFRDPRAVENGRAASTAIYYLLGAGEVSAWHRVDAAEIWHFYAGAPLALDISATGDAAQRHLLGPQVTRGEHPQIVVPRTLAERAQPRRLDAGRLHRRAGLRIFPLRARPRPFPAAASRGGRIGLSKRPVYFWAPILTAIRILSIRPNRCNCAISPIRRFPRDCRSRPPRPPRRSIRPRSNSRRDAASLDILASIGMLPYAWDIATDRLSWGENLADVLAPFAHVDLSTGRAYGERLGAQSATSRFDAIVMSTGSDDGRGGASMRSTPSPRRARPAAARSSGSRIAANGSPAATAARATPMASSASSPSATRWSAG